MTQKKTKTLILVLTETLLEPSLEANDIYLNENFIEALAEYCNLYDTTIYLLENKVKQISDYYTDDFETLYKQKVELCLSELEPILQSKITLLYCDDRTSFLFMPSPGNILHIMYYEGYTELTDCMLVGNSEVTLQLNNNLLDLGLGINFSTTERFIAKYV